MSVPKHWKRFWNRVDISNDGCWEWPTTSTRQKGVIYLGGKTTLAHRVSYRDFYGVDPGKFVVMHKCDNYLCVRPDHLSLGTVKENNADRASKCRNGDKGWLGVINRNRHTQGTKFARLMGRVDINGDECWPFLDNDKSLYDKITINGQYYLAHRLAYEEFYGIKLKEVDVIMHTCDTPKCVRPDHLCVGTLSNNSCDMVRKSRHPVGKLTPEYIKIIRERIENGDKQREIANDFGVDQSMVSYIATGASWSYV